MLCACGSQKNANQCCTPFILDKAIPKTPEALMRSRYTAYTQANIDYIEKTMQGKAAHQFNAKDAKKHAAAVKWMGLNVMARKNGKAKNQGFVEFAARFEEEGKIQFIHETSEFHLIDERWYYVDGQHAEDPGRNSPCLCGSNKKYKRCCGA